MNNVGDLLRNLAVESGVIVPEPEVVDNSDVLVEVLAENLAEQDEMGLVETLDRAEETQDIAVQLDELADRAEAVEEQAPNYATGVLEVAVESLHREYQVLMRSHGLSFVAGSFESAGSDLGRVDGLKKDARRLAEGCRNMASSMTDYSQEGALSRFLRNDVSKLDKARASLQNTNGRLQRAIDALREKAIVITNDGYARFMTQNNEPVKDIVAAIEAESKYLNGTHSAIEQSVKALQEAADKLSNGGSVDALKNSNIFDAIKKANSNQGALMGNYSIMAEEVVDHLIVPKFVRSNGYKLNGKALAFAAFSGAYSAFVGNRLMRAVALGGLMVGAPGFALGALTAAKTVAGVMGVAAAKNSYKSTIDETNVKSRGSATDVQKAVRIVLDYNKYTDYRVNADVIQEKLKAARGKTTDLSDEQKKERNKVISSLETSLNRLVRLSEEVYEQAYYTTTMMSSLVDGVLSRLK